MALSTFSIFYFGYTITDDNKFINFKEDGGSELTGTIEIGSFTLTEILTKIKTAMDGAPGAVGTHTVTVDRDTRQITILSDVTTLDLLISTGSQAGSSPWSLLGFGASDLTGSSSYTGASGSGQEYQPQFVLQDFIDKNNFQEKIDASVNESAQGIIEAVSFGTRKFYEFSLKFITDLPQDCRVIKNNPTGVADAQNFMQEIIKKNPIEFMKDIDNRSVFDKVILESTPTVRDGTGYRLDELVDRNLPGYFEINRLRFRVV